MDRQEELYRQRQALTIERNKYIDSIFWFLPSYKKKLAEVDKKINMIERELYNNYHEEVVRLLRVVRDI